MNPRFLAFIPLLLDLETEHNRDGSVRTEHDPADPGGTTKFGIDQRSHPTVNIAALDEADATAIYFNEWLAHRVEDLPARLGELLYDIHVNGGPGAAWLQRFLGVPDDGFIGPKTLAAARALDAWGIRQAVISICTARDARFSRLATRFDAAGNNIGPSSLARFYQGWLNRSARVRTFCLASIDEVAPPASVSPAPPSTLDPRPSTLAQ